MSGGGDERAVRLCGCHPGPPAGDREVSVRLELDQLGPAGRRPRHRPADDRAVGPTDSRRTPSVKSCCSTRSAKSSLPPRTPARPPLTSSPVPPPRTTRRPALGRHRGLLREPVDAAMAGARPAWPGDLHSPSDRICPDLGPTGPDQPVMQAPPSRTPPAARRVGRGRTWLRCRRGPGTGSLEVGGPALRRRSDHRSSRTIRLWSADPELACGTSSARAAWPRRSSS
jgi:hypothetical protein